MSELRNEFFIDPEEGFNRGVWRSGSNMPPAYPFDGDVSITVADPNTNGGQPFTLPHSKMMWELFMKTLFPSITQDDFNNTVTDGQQGKYFTQLAEVAIKDFFYSFYIGQDDIYQQKGIVNHDQIFTTGMWNQLSKDTQQLAIKAYLMTRGPEFETDRVANAHLIYDLTERGKSVFYWISRLLVNLLEDLQLLTIKSAQLATQLTEMQSAVSDTMKDSKFNPTIPGNTSDYFTLWMNNERGRMVELLRTHRTDLQKKASRAGSVLENRNSEVEQQAAAITQYLSTVNRTTKLFFKK
ncbi:hypothetical protein N9N03_00930 [Chlamydiia bacterium]|nr:hypothetical protein [Chlamydiia bacterium]